MDALCWSDYLCPWCYVGTDRSALLRSMGVRVVTLPFELHPEIPPDGVERPGVVARWSAIAAEAEDAGLPFDPPARLPNTRRVLEVSEWVRREGGLEAHATFSDTVFRAHFAQRRRIDDADELGAFVESVGLSAAEAFDAVAGGEPGAWVDESMALARDIGVGGTPAWVLGEGLLVPGVQPRSFFERVVTKLQSREAAETN